MAFTSGQMLEATGGKTCRSIAKATLAADLNSAAPNGPVLYADVSITNAELLALRATPKTLVAAPGAGKVIAYLSSMWFFDYTAAYTLNGGTLNLKYDNGSGASADDISLNAATLLTATEDSLLISLPYGNPILTKTQADNKALVLHNGGAAEFTGGNAANVLRVRIAYRILSAGW